MTQNNNPTPLTEDMLFADELSALTHPLPENAPLDLIESAAWFTRIASIYNPDEATRQRAARRANELDEAAKNVVAPVTNGGVTDAEFSAMLHANRELIGDRYDALAGDFATRREFFVKRFAAWALMREAESYAAAHPRAILTVAHIAQNPWRAAFVRIDCELMARAAYEALAPLAEDSGAAWRLYGVPGDGLASDRSAGTRDAIRTRFRYG